MSLEKKGNIWQVDITICNERVRKSTGTANKREAKRIHDQWLSMGESFFSLPNQSSRTATGKTWNDATDRWLLEKKDKRSISDDYAKIEWLSQHMGNRLLKDVTSSVVKEIANKKMAEGVANGTVNRYIALMVSIMRMSSGEWEWTNHAVSVTRLKEADRNIRWLKADEAKRLIDAVPDHLRDVVIFGLATGLRRSNVLGMKWDMIDLKRKVMFVNAVDMKGDSHIGLPLNDLAMSVIQRHLDNGTPHIFSRNGKPFKSISAKTWNGALKRAGIDKFRFHDLRHTFASWLIQNGVSTAELQELGGWKSAAMVRKYAHLSPEKLMASSQTVAKTFSML